MKKIYLGALTLAVCSASFAQTESTNKSMLMSKSDISTSAVKPVHDLNTNDDRAIVLWSDDCNSAANWSFFNTSTPALDWYVETSTDLDALTPTALGASLATFGSATAAGGFLMINSDNAGAGTEVMAQARITVPTNTLSTEANVKLRFSHAYRWWNDTRGVRVSTDGGTNWTDFEITDEAGYDLGYSSGLQESGNPQVETIDISAIAGNANDVMIEFYYDDNADWGWFWAVDDVEIIRTPDNDLAVDQNWFGSVGTLLLPYYMIPDEQIAPITFSSMVTNIGLVDQTNTILTVDVNSGASTLTSATGFTSVSGASDSLYTTTTYTPAALGTYTFDMTLVSTDLTDDDLTNNVIASQSVEVTDYTYGRDDGTETGSISNVTDNTGLSMSIGNIMNIFADGVIGALDIKISDDTDNAGKVMYGAVYILNGAGDAYDWAGQSSDYTIVSSDVDGFVTLVFETPIAVTAGQEVLIVAGHYGDDVAFSYAQNAYVETVLGFTDDGASLFNLTGASVIMIRADMRDFSGVEELAVDNISVSQNVPNPFTGNTVVSYNLTEASNVSIEIIDVTGKVVTTINEGNQAAGEHNITIDGSKLAEGTYFYTFTAGEFQVTKRMVVSK